MKRLLAAVGLALTVLIPATVVHAETDLASGEAIRSGSGKYYRSDKSPIRRQTVSYGGKYGANTIIVNTTERRLYYTLGNGRAIKYGVGVGRVGFTWSGTHSVSRKAEWPGWTPPPQMIRREAAKGRKLPAHMKGGPNNPLGARALYIGSTIYRIHGTNQPWTIGQAMSSGCIRMANDDVIHLYNQVGIGTKVVVIR
jgi:lipoprotein-anchoring transpeptidase ErfK/SrfK